MPRHTKNDPDGMNKRRSERRRSSGDSPIGLTEAFPPVSSESGQSQETGNIGLTEAFPAVLIDEDEPKPSPDSEGEASEGGKHAGGYAYRGDQDGEYPDALESLEPRATSGAGFDDELPLPAEDDPTGQHVDPQDGKRKRDKKADIPPYMRKSRRMRKILIAVVVLLVVIIGALCYFAYQWVNESQRLAVQQTLEQQDAQNAETIADDGTSNQDASTETSKVTEVPNLAAVLGLTQDEAVAALEHGATVTSTKEVNEEDNDVKTSVTVALTDEPADSRSGTPTVYLGLAEDGSVIQAGYSAATASLGYGTLSFTDAVQNEHVVEETLREAGVEVEDGAAVLPSDKTEYSTYASDGTTLVRENCPFSGTVDINGVAHEWSSVLLYDYSTANTTGNLSDTIRIIYVYINA